MLMPPRYIRAQCRMDLIVAWEMSRKLGMEAAEGFSFLRASCMTNRKSYMVYRTEHFSMTLKDPIPRFQGQSIL